MHCWLQRQRWQRKVAITIAMLTLAGQRQCEIRDNLGLIPFFSFYFFTLLAGLHPLVWLRLYGHESVHKRFVFLA